MDVGQITAGAVTEIDERVLTKTGSSGLLGKGYLHETPFIEYLQPDERIGVLLWSHTTAPDPEGLAHSRVSLTGYRAITAITDERVLAVTGSADGNQLIDIPLQSIEGFAMGSRGRVRTEQWIRLFLPDGTLTVFDRSGAERSAVRQYLLDSVTTAKREEVTDTIAEARTLADNDELKAAYQTVQRAIGEREALQDWVEMYERAASIPGDDLGQRSFRLANRMDLDDCLVRAHEIEQDGQYETARAAYNKASEIVESTPGIDAPVDISVHLTRVELSEIQRTVQELTDHRAQTSDPTTVQNAYREAVSVLDSYEDRLSAATAAFARSEPTNQCDLCSRAGSTQSISIDETEYRVCSWCEAFDTSGELWSHADIEEQRESFGWRLVALAREAGTDHLEHPAPKVELRIALRQVAGRSDRLPTVEAFEQQSPYRSEQVLGKFDNWGRALQAAECDLQSFVVDEIQAFAEERGLVPTKREMLATSSYPDSVFEAAFEEFEAAVSAAGYTSVNLTDAEWKTTLRGLVDGESTAPLPSDGRAEGINVSTLLSHYGTWEEVLSKAGILRSVADGTREKLLTNVEEVATALEHVPSKAEYAEYGAFDLTDIRSEFGTFDKALAAADLSQPTDYTPTGPLDEPPSGGDSIPSHTTLLRELNWLRQRHGPSKAREQFSELASYDRGHFERQFGSVDDGFDLLKTHLSTTTGGGYVPKRLLNDRLSELGEALARPPTLLDLLYHADISLEKFAEKFDSLAELQAAAGYPRETTVVPTETLLADVRSVSESVGHAPTIGEYSDHGNYEFAALVRRFDSWLAALQAAGLDALSLPFRTAVAQEREVDRVRFETLLRRSTGLGIEDVLLDELHRLADEFSARPADSLVEQFGQYPVSAYVSTFGSLDVACTAAGLDSDPKAASTATYEQQLRSELTALSERFDHHPTERLVNACGETPVIAYISAYGSWQAALDAAFDQPDPPSVGKPYLDTALRTAIENAEPGEFQTPPDIVTNLPAECTHRDLTLVYGSVAEGIATVGPHARDLFPTVESSETSRDEEDSATSEPGVSQPANSETASETEEPPEDTLQSDAETETDAEHRAALLETLRSLRETLGRLPKTTDLDETEFSQYDYTSVFGNWDTALAEAGIDKEQLLLDEIRRVTNELGRVPSSKEIGEHGPYWGSTYSAHFGSWAEALEQVNLPESADGDATPTTGESSNSDSDTDTDDPTREALLTELRRCNNTTDGLLKAHHMTSEGAYSANDYIREFGSWDQALEAIGVNKRELLLAELERVWDELGEPPRTVDMNERSRHSPSMYYDVFESWGAALDAVARADADDRSTASEAESQDPEAGDEPPTESETGGSESSPSESAPSRTELLDELVRLNEATEGLMKATDMRDEGAYNLHHYTDEFGSWDTALSEAGIERKEQLVAEIERVWSELGRQPSTVEMNEQGRVSATTVQKYFPSWEAACRRAAPDESELESSTDLTQVDVLATWDDIARSERLSGTYLGRVIEIDAQPDARKEARLLIEDIYQTECWLDIWAKHSINTAFQEGHWYLLSDLRGKRWIDGGTIKKQLSSTRDLSVVDLGDDPDARELRQTAGERGLLDPTRRQTSSHSSATDPPETSRSTSNGETTQPSNTTGETASSPSEEDGSPSSSTSDDDADIVDKLMDDLDL